MMNFLGTVSQARTWLENMGLSPRDKELMISKMSFSESEGDMSSFPVSLDKQVIERCRISGDAVRGCCMLHGWYTRGNCEEYDRLLGMADGEEYSLNLLYRLAEDIYNHSAQEGLMIEAIMFSLSREAVDRFYFI